MTKEVKQGLSDTEVTYKNEIYRLTTEVDAVRKEKEAAESRASKAEQAAHEHAAKSSEIENLKEHLRAKAEELQSKVKDFEDLDRSVSQIETRKRELDNQSQQQQAQISQHEHAMDDLKRKHESALDSLRTSEQQSAQIAIQQAHNEMNVLEKEKEDLQVKLYEAQSQASTLSDTETALTNERDNLRRQNAELRTAKESCEEHLAKNQEAKTKETGQHEEAIDTLRREHERSDAALKEAEAKIRRQDAEYRKKLEFDRGKFELRVQSLCEELEDLKNAPKASRASVKQQSSATSAAPQATPTSLQNMGASKNRKKVIRDPKLVQKSASKDTTLSGAAKRHPTRQQVQGPSHGQNLFDQESQVSNQFGKVISDKEHDLVDPAAEPIENTQDMEFIAFSNNNFQDDLYQSMSHKPVKGSQHRPSDPIDRFPLSSSLSSDSIEQLEKDVLSTPTRKSQPCSLDVSQDRVLETPTPSDSQSITSLHDRPRSQANTASRMMPPPSISQRSRELGKASSDEHKKTSGHAVAFGNAGTPLRRSGGSSPDYMHPPSSVSKHTYTHHSAEVQNHDEHAQGRLQGSSRNGTQKRKSSVDEDLPFKKQRTSSKSIHTSSSGSVTGAQSSSQFTGRSSSKTQMLPASRASSRSGLQPGQNSAYNAASKGRAQQSSASKPSVTHRGPGVIMPPRQKPSRQIPARQTAGRQSTTTRRTRSQSGMFDLFLQCQVLR